MAAAKNQDVARLERAGRLLYGDRWQSPLARAMGVRQSVIGMALSGDRPPTPETMRLLKAALDKESRRLKSAAGELEKLRKEIE